MKNAWNADFWKVFHQKDYSSLDMRVFDIVLTPKWTGNNSVSYFLKNGKNMNTCTLWFSNWWYGLDGRDEWVSPLSSAISDSNQLKSILRDSLHFETVIANSHWNLHNDRRKNNDLKLIKCFILVRLLVNDMET